MLAALKRYVQEREPPNNIAILYTVDEECGKTGVDTFVRETLPRLGWRPQGAIVGEPTELAPMVAHNGVVRWTISTTGVRAHSCDPAKGRSAISMMTKVIQAIEERYAPSLTASHPLTGKAQCSINLIRGGSQINIIPGECSIEVDRRIVPGEDPDEVLPEVERVLDELRGEHPDLVVAQHEPFKDAPLDPAGGEEFAARLQHVLRERGLPDTLHGNAYGTDASHLSAADIPCVVIGPGNIAQAHTADEWLDLAQLEGAVELYLGIMLSRPTPSESRIL